MQQNRIYERVRVGESCTARGCSERLWDEAPSAAVHTCVGPAPSPASPGGSLSSRPQAGCGAAGSRLPRTRYLSSSLGIISSHLLPQIELLG